jgi:plasmid maintenance system antidote protein VapI
MTLETDWTFDPDWTIAPGATLRDWIDESGLSECEVAARCDIPDALFNAILSGEALLTVTRAHRVAVGTDTDVVFWLARERDYRADLAAGKIDTTRATFQRTSGGE